VLSNSDARLLNKNKKAVLSKAHMKTAALQSRSADRFPAVVFIKFAGIDNEHPGYTDVVRGQQHVADIVHAVQNSRIWKDTAIIVTYDENGGRWDHIAPPVRADGWGTGVRVPTLVISPFARQGFIDQHEYETVSILKLIEFRFNLARLGQRDADPAVKDLVHAFAMH
jgi:acid phosphatase